MKSKGLFWAGSILLAILASSCCWLPSSVRGVKDVRIDFDQKQAKVVVDKEVDDNSLVNAFSGNQKYSAKLLK